MKKKKWNQIETDILDWLEKNYSQTLQFRNSYQAIIGFPPNGFRSDGMLTNGETLLAIEIEASQTHPDTNVGKYWLLYQSKKYEKIVLFHIYTPAFDSYGWRKTLAEFYVKQMQDNVPLEYNLMDFRRATNYDEVLEEIKCEIRERIKTDFNQ